MLKRLAIYLTLAIFALSAAVPMAAAHAVPAMATVAAEASHGCHEAAPEPKAPPAPIQDECCKSGICDCPMSHAQTSPVLAAPPVLPAAALAAPPKFAWGVAHPRSTLSESLRRPPRA